MTDDNPKPGTAAHLLANFDETFGSIPQMRTWQDLSPEEFRHEVRECESNCTYCREERLTAAEERLILAAIELVAKLGLQSGAIVDAVEAVLRERSFMGTEERIEPSELKGIR